MIESERHALVVGVLPELRDRYLELHQSVWPQVEATLVAWWTHTDPCQVRIADERILNSKWQPIDEIWHLT